MRVGISSHLTLSPALFEASFTQNPRESSATQDWSKSWPTNVIFAAKARSSATTRLGQPVSGGSENLAFDDFSGLDAARAHADALAATVDLGLHGLKVDVPPATGGVVGVRDVIAKLRAFAAEITFLCHDLLQS